MLTGQRGARSSASSRTSSSTRSVSGPHCTSSCRGHSLRPRDRDSWSRPAGDVAAIAPVVRSVAQQMSIGSNFDQVAPLDALVARATAQPRFTSRVVAAFGILALVLAGVGIYGTLSFMVGTRRREIGIRMALGASRERVLRTVLWRGLAPAAAGALVGGNRGGCAGPDIPCAALQRDVARSALARRRGRGPAAGRDSGVARTRRTGGADRPGPVAARGLGGQPPARGVSQSP